MLITLPYCQYDQGQAQRLLDWIQELGGPGLHKLILFREKKAAHLTGTHGATEVEFVDPYSQWPISTTNAFQSVARYMEAANAPYFLFIEPDVVPMRKDWLDALQAEYERSSRPFMGALVPRNGDVPEHTSGIGIYPGKMTLHCGQALMLYEDAPWDTAVGNAILQQAHCTDLIQHHWRHPGFKSMDEVWSRMTKECVLWHSDKSGSLINLLRNNLGSAEKENSGQDGSNQSTNSPAVTPAPTLLYIKECQRQGIPTDQGILVNLSSIKPWNELTKAEKKKRRQEQAANARAAKQAKKGGDAKCAVNADQQLTEHTNRGVQPCNLPIQHSNVGATVQPVAPTKTTTTNPPYSINTGSETSASRSILVSYCDGLGLDIGFGGDAVVPAAITFDMERPYTSVGSDKQIMKGSCRDLSMFCDNSLDYIYSAHLLEDFSYSDLIDIIKEWRRVLKTSGLLITNCPDQQKFLAHCQKTGQPLNLAHHEQDFSLVNFNSRVLDLTGSWERVMEQHNFGAYSWLSVVKKI